MAYRNSAGQAGLLMRHDLSTYELPTGGASVTGMRWSPDGRRLAVSTAERLWLFVAPCGGE